MSSVAIRARSWLERYWSFAAVMGVAMAVRIAWWATYVHGIENEGAEYARLAENLMAGNGYIGIFGGPHVFFPPLFPWLIGIVSIVVHDVETAARIVSLLSGCGIVGLVWVISQRLVSPHVGLLAGLFAAVHPTLVAYSVSTYVEPLYTFLILAATLFCLRFVRNRSRVELAAAGAFWGLAYLTRPEAVAGGAAAAACVALVAYFPQRRLSSSVRSGALVSAAMLVFVLPNVIWLSAMAGEFRWEGKSGANSQLNERIQAGMSYSEAARGLEGENGRGGPFLNMEDQREFLAYRKSGGLNFITTLLRDPLPRVRGTVLDLVYARNLGSPWILLLAAVGLVFGLRWRERRWEGFVFLGFVAVLGLILLLTEWRYSRFFLATLSALTVWSAAGAMALSRAALTSVRGPGRSPASDTAALALAMPLLLAIGFRTLPSTLTTPELDQAHSSLARELGQAIKRDFDPGTRPGSRPSIMGFGLAPGFYSGGTMAYLPYSEEAAALDYVHAAAPDYLILASSEAGQAPYVSAWLEGGIPDACAVPILDSPETPGQRARLWRWAC